MKKVFTIVMFLITMVCYGFAQIDVGTIAIGKIVSIESKVLKEKRTLHISLPDSYETSGMKYPVLYMLDARGNFRHAAAVVRFLSTNGRIPEMIVVGIQNTDRNRDLTPMPHPTRKNYGGADNFFKFFNTELFPYVEKNYRTAPYRILSGPSLAGMFTVYTLFAHPEMFEAYLGTSPGLMVVDDWVVKYVEKELAKKKPLKKYLYFNCGEYETRFVPYVKKLEALLKKNTVEGLRWDSNIQQDQNHGSVQMMAVYEGLEKLFKEYRLPGSTTKKGLEAIKKHSAKIKAIYGDGINVSEQALNRIGYTYLGKKKIDTAVEVFKYNVELYPGSANAYDSLGEGLQAGGKLEEAKSNFKKAVDMGKKTNHPDYKAFKTNYERLVKGKTKTKKK
ncbi:MAG: hypothetical protein GY765_33375 [bacterium]|nr:hypothetical protein [bacterium]